MNILYPAGSKRDWFDRNPLNKILSAGWTLYSPHGLTSRASYTVPAGKRACILACSLLWYRNSAAAPVGAAENRLYINDGSNNFPIVINVAIDNTLSNIHSVNLTNIGWLTAGQICAIYTADGSTNGDIYYLGSFTYLEFDA
jgi:hypothetical protein